MAELKPEWRERMEGVQHPWSAIATEAGFTTSAVLGVMTGATDDPGHKTVKAIEAALDRLRGTCPCCGQKLPQEVARNAAVRRTGRKDA